MADEVATEAVEIESHEMNSFAGVEPQHNYQFNHQNRNSFLSNFSSSSITSCVVSYTPFANALVCGFLVATCVPLVVGVAFTSICFQDKNYNAAVVSFFTACFSVGTSSLFVLHLLKRLEQFHDQKTLEGLKFLGMIMSGSSGLALGVYTILAFMKRQAFSLKGSNYFSSAIFTGVLLAASIELYMVSQWYQNALKARELLNKDLSLQVQATISALNFQQPQQPDQASFAYPRDHGYYISLD